MQKLPHLAVLAGIFAIVAVARGSDAQTSAAWARLQHRSAAAFRALARETFDLTAADPTAAQLSFSEFLLRAGDGGVEFSPRLKSLAGKRVRLSGYMVRQPPSGSPGGFVLSPAVVTLDEDGMCAPAELPPHAVHVLGAGPQARVAFRPGRVTLTGVLEIGPIRGPDRRVTNLRLRADPWREASADLAEETVVGTAGAAP